MPLMFHVKRFCFTFIASLIIAFSYSQGSVKFTDKPFILNIERDTAIQSFLNKQQDFAGLSSEEKELLYWLNYVRQKPADFNRKVLDPFLKQFPEVKNAYSRSLAKTLSAMNGVAPLSPATKLQRVAAAHAKDLGSKGLSLSHSSSSGASFQQRMEAAGLANCVSENIYEGKLNALETVIFLLIDNGVKSLGHRKNILDPDARFVGVSFYPVKNRAPYYFSVQDFTCE